MCQEAQELEKSGKKLGEMDFRFFFFPWWKHPDYVLKEDGEIPKETKEYFEKIKEEDGIELTPKQQSWYVKKQKTQFDDMLREFPSTPEEAFKMSADGNYYGKLIAQLRERNHLYFKGKSDPLEEVSYLANFPVFTAWDLGYTDKTAIWVYQYYHDRIFILDYLEGSEKPLPEYLEELKKKPYADGYWSHFVPHDAAHHEYGTGLTRVEIAYNHHFEFTVAPPPQKISVQEGIDAVKAILPKCYFDGEKCEKGISDLEKYRREWNQKTGEWSHRPLHNEASHSADAFRVLATTLSLTEYEPMPLDPRKQREWKIRNGLECLGL